MSSRARMRREIQAKLGRAGLLLLLLPGLLFALAAGDQDLLLHAHGSTPVHVHLVPHDASAHTHAHESEHAEDPRSHEHEGDPLDGDPLDGDPIDGDPIGGDPIGGVGGCTCEFRLCSPGPLLPGSARHLDSGRWILARWEIDAAEPWRPRFGERAPTPDRGSSEWSLRRKRRSVLVSLLSSSRAILI